MEASFGGHASNILYKNPSPYFDKNKRKILRMNINEDNNRVPARLINNIRILPGQTVSVPVYIGVSSAKVLFRPSFNLQQQIPLIMMNTILNVHCRKSFISLYNPTSYPHVLSKGIILGTIKCITLAFMNNFTFKKRLIDNNVNNLIQQNNKKIREKTNEFYKFTGQPPRTVSVADKNINMVGAVVTQPKMERTIYKQQRKQIDAYVANNKNDLSSSLKDSITKDSNTSVFTSTSYYNFDMDQLKTEQSTDPII